jgi:hypothetical protein
MIRKVVMAAAVLTTIALAQSPKETNWEPPLADGGAPECPQHLGRRVSYSATAGVGTFSASIIGTAERNSEDQCASQAKLVIRGGSEKSILLPHPDREHYEIADFSPDTRSFLFVLDKGLEAPAYEEIRNIEVAVVDISRPEIRPINVWDLFGWGKCEATVEPQGFMSDGRVLLLARPSTRYSEVRNDCVPDWGLYATNLKSRPVRLPDDPKVPRFGTITSSERQACKSDPDIVEACFVVHGRIRAGNGTPSLRIWRQGTSRILGVNDDFPLPDALDGEDLLNGEVWGDFEVCPFAKDRPGVMRMVCVESASHLTYKKY